MAGEAERRAGIVHHKKFSKLVVVRVVTGGALQPAFLIQLNRTGQLSGVFDFGIARRQRRIVDERNRMVGGQVRAQIGRAGRHRRRAALHGDRQRATTHAAQRNRAIVTTQAEPRRTVWLRDNDV